MHGFRWLVVAVIIHFYYLWHTYPRSDIPVFDPRLTVALWLRHLRDNNDAVPFQWSTVLGVRQIESSCKSFRERNGFQALFGCQDSPLPFLHDINATLSSQDRELVGATYMVHALPPRKVILVANNALLLYDTTVGKIQLNTTEEFVDIQEEWASFKTSIHSQGVPKPDISWKLSTHGHSITDQKYFHEVDRHQDWRFYRLCDHRPVIHRLARAWFRFARKAGIVTWLAHGLALGWYWSKMNLPWDDDIDVQVPYSELERLVKYNQSVVFDLWDEQSVNFGTGGFFVDVNSNFRSTENNDNNVIDARFIDIFSGYFIDITAVMLVDRIGRASDELSQLVEPSYLDLRANPTQSHQDMHASIAKTTEMMIANSSLLRCKDNHFYTLAEILPLRASTFEGVVAHVPHAIESILKREYPRGLQYRRYEGYTFIDGIWCRRGEDTKKFGPILSHLELTDILPVWTDPWVRFANGSRINVR